MNRFVYKTTNTHNGKFYIGAHSTSNMNDGYLGSGVALRRAIRKYGAASFNREILEYTETDLDLYIREQHHIKKHISDPLCYNLHSGGKGGWAYVNIGGLNMGARNSMKDPKVVAKVVSTRRATYSKDPQKYATVARRNLLLAVAANTGALRSEGHRQKLAKAMIEHWQNNHKTRRDSLSSYFLVTDPTGDSILTNRLEEFCRERGLPYTTLWKTSVLLRPCVRGRGKGWSCRKI